MQRKRRNMTRLVFATLLDGGKIRVVDARAAADLRADPAGKGAGLQRKEASASASLMFEGAASNCGWRASVASSAGNMYCGRSSFAATFCAAHRRAGQESTTIA